MHVEEDKLKEVFKVLQNSPTPPASDNGDAPMEDPFGPLPSDDDGSISLRMRSPLRWPASVLLLFPRRLMPQLLQ